MNNTLNTAVTIALAIALAIAFALLLTTPALGDAKSVRLPAGAAADLGFADAPAEVPTQAVAEAVGFRLYNAVARAAVGTHAPFDPRPIAFKYGHQFGRWPQIHRGEVLHGGTPLGGDLAAHAAAVRRDALDASHAPGTWVFVDYERWGPTMPASGEYRDLAEAQTRERYPEFAREFPAVVPALAAHLWEVEAERFYLETLRAAKLARPDLKWGYYYPQARHFWKGYDTDAGDERRAENDRFARVWAECDVFAASVYCFYPTREAGRIPYATPDQNRAYVGSNVAEWVRLKGGPEDSRPVVAVIEPAIHPGNRDRLPAGERFVTASDYRLWMEAAADAGADGLIVWGVALDADVRADHLAASQVYGEVFADFVRDRAIAE